MSRVVDLEEASRLTGLTKIELGRRFQARDLKGHNDPKTKKLVFYLEDLRRVNGYEPPEPPPSPKPQPPPPPKPEPWTPSHAELAALIKLDEQGRDAAMADLIRRHPHLRDWFRDNPLPPVFRKQRQPSSPQAKPEPSPPPPPRPQSWQTSWQGQATWQQYQVPPKPPDPAPVRPTPPEPPRRQQPPPFRPAPPQPPRTEPPRSPPEPLPDLWPVLRSVLIELAMRPFRRLQHWWSGVSNRIKAHELGGEFARLWENRAGRWIIIVTGLYVVKRLLIG